MFSDIPKNNSGHLSQHRVHPMELRIGFGSLRKMLDGRCASCWCPRPWPRPQPWLGELSAGKGGPGFRVVA